MTDQIEQFFADDGSLRFDVSVGLFTGASFEAQVKKWGASRDAK